MMSMGPRPWMVWRYVVGGKDFNRIIVIQLDAEGWLLTEAEFAAGFVPECMAVGAAMSDLLHHGAGDAVHHDDGRQGRPVMQ